MLVEKYLEACATRSVANKKGEYSFKVLLAMHLCHIPRKHEMIRTLFDAIEKIADSDIEVDEEDENNPLNIALSAIVKCEEIADDGLRVMGYNLDEGDDNGN